MNLTGGDAIMKRFFALVLSVLMILSLCSFASAASSEITLHARDMNMNYLTGTFSVKDEGSDYYRIIDAAGNELMGTDRKYTSVYPSSSYPVFTVEVESADGIHDEGLVDGYGNVLVPAQYADVNIISNRWQAGILLTPCAADDKDYTFTNYRTDEKSFYRIDTADIYFDGVKVGSLNRSEYGGGNCTAYNAYLAVTNMERVRTYYNSKMEKSPVTGDTSGEYTQTYNKGKTTYVHNGTGQQAFVPSCTLTADEVLSPYCFEDGVLYDLQGNQVFKGAHDYSTVRRFFNGYATVYFDSHYGIIDLQGNEVLPPEYDSISSYEDNLMYKGFAGVVKDGKFGFVDAQGNVTSPFVYSSDIVSHRGSFATIKNLDGTIIVLTAGAGELQEHFAEVSIYGSSHGNAAFVGENADGKTCVIDIYGKTLVPYTDCRSMNVSNDGTTVLIYYGNREYTILQFDAPAATVSAPEAPAADDGTWTCENGHAGNTGNFCTECGAKKPETTLTKCPDCGYEFGDSVPNFCPNCGKNLK